MLTGIMRYIWCGVEKPMNAMSTITFDHAEAMCLHMFLDDITNFAITFARLDNLNCFL